MEILFLAIVAVCYIACNVFIWTGFTACTASCENAGLSCCLR